MLVGALVYLPGLCGLSSAKPCQAPSELCTSGTVRARRGFSFCVRIIHLARRVPTAVYCGETRGLFRVLLIRPASCHTMPIHGKGKSWGEGFIVPDAQTVRGVESNCLLYKD